MAGRGMAVYIRENMFSTAVELKSGEEGEATVWCEVKLKDQDRLLIGIVYRSPNSTEEMNQQLTLVIKDIVNRKSSHLLMMGDFNYPGIDWDLEITEGSQDEENFLQQIKDCFLWQHVKRPTHFRTMQKANILDLIFTNEEGMIHELNYEEPIGKSDHLVLSWIYNCYVPRKATQQLNICTIKGIMKE
jgi:endonuclease/exonuclease/phosphatase family metal-dependent hydrolase